jgi:hypothetical protein
MPVPAYNMQGRCSFPIKSANPVRQLIKMVHNQAGMHAELMPDIASAFNDYKLQAANSSAMCLG